MKLVILILFCFAHFSIVFGQKKFDDIINILDNKPKTPKYLLNRLIKNQLNNIKKNDGMRLSENKFYYLKDSTLLVLKGVDLLNKSNYINNQFALFAIDKKSHFNKVYEYDINRNKILAYTLYFNIKIGSSIYYKNNQVVKIVNNDSLFVITPDSIISIVEKSYSINLSEINRKLNLNKFYEYNTVQLKRDLFNGPRYYVLYEQTTNDENKTIGFYLVIDGVTGRIITQRNVSNSSPKCGN